MCSLVSDSTSKELSKKASGKNVSNVPIGKHILSCVRTTTETVTKFASTDGGVTKREVEKQTNMWKKTETHNLKCLPRPSVNEI